MFTSNPGMLSNLSIVPPVNPSPLPDIFGTYIPHTAQTGAITRLVLSPIPPVLCLSTVTPFILPRSRTSPESRITSVRQRVSSSERELKHTAISHADIW